MRIISLILRRLLGAAFPQEKVFSSAAEAGVQQSGRVPDTELSLQTFESSTFRVILQPNETNVSLCRAHDWHVREIGAAAHCEVNGSPARIVGYILSATKLVVWIRVQDGTKLSDPQGQQVFLSWMDTSSSEQRSTKFHIRKQKGSVG